MNKRWSVVIICWSWSSLAEREIVKKKMNTIIYYYFFYNDKKKRD